MTTLERWPWRSLVLAAAALLVAAAPGAQGALVLELGSAWAREPWRLLSCHLVHGSSHHLAWNVVALLGLGFLFERSLGSRWWTLMLASGAVVSAGLALLPVETSSYRGLSGALNGLWVGGALALARRERGAVAWLYRSCVLADLAKIALEAWRGAALLTDAAALGGEPVPLAHALGALGGMAWLALGSIRDGPNGSLLGPWRGRVWSRLTPVSAP